MNRPEGAQEVVLTHCGKFGDFLYGLPIGQWIYKQWGLQIHWVLPSCFGPFRYIERLLMAQAMTRKVSLVSYKPQNYDCGGQPYRFTPMDYVTIAGPSFNLGLRHYPNKFLSEFYAEEHGLGFDPKFQLELPLVCTGEGTGEILRSSERSMLQLVPQAVSLPTSEDLFDLTMRLKRSAEFHTWFCGMAVLCWFAGIPATVYRVNGHAPIGMYFPESRELTFKEVVL